MFCSNSLQHIYSIKNDNKTLFMRSYHTKIEKTGLRNPGIAFEQSGSWKGKLLIISIYRFNSINVWDNWCSPLSAKRL